MSDTDVDYGTVNPSDHIMNARRAATGEAITSLDADPEKVARAYELGRATGDHPSLVFANLDNYEAQTRAALTSTLLSSNDHLREYINADPMRAKLSNDDYANLDEFSGKLSAFRQSSSEQGILGLPIRAAGGMLSAAWEGFHKGIGEGPIGEWTTTVPQLKDNLFAQKMWTALGSPIEVGMRLFGGGIHALTEGAQAGAAEAYQTFTGDKQGAARFARDIAGMVEQQATGMGVHGAVGDAVAFAKYATALQRGKLWLDHGLEPPAGIDPLIDKVKLEQNNADIANLNEIVQVAQRSATRLRDPDTFAAFIRMRDEGTIAIDGEAVARLYGDKVPELEDGLLGFHEGTAAQLETAKASGGDIEIPLADFVAKIDPEVWKALKDDIRVRPGGITKNEAALRTEQKTEVGEAIHPTNREVLNEPLPSLRAHTALEPLFSIGDRKLELQKQPRKVQPYDSPDFQPHDFLLQDENGSSVGYINITEMKGGKDIYVDMITGVKGHGPATFGPALMRNLLKQLKEQFPNGERLGGLRVSGARDKAGAVGRDATWIKFDEALSDPQTFRDLMKDQWENIGGGVEANFNVDVKAKADIIKAIGDELARITPTATATPVSGFREGTNSRNIKGAFIQYSNRLPEILYSLAGDDPVGVARHEAIHHLRKEGFFTPSEWSILERAARDNEWQSRFNINNRYPKLHSAAKLEEAIADGYKAWVKGGEVAPKLVPIFERLKTLLDNIVAKIKEILGREPTWDELFGKVERGEVGGRTGSEHANSVFRKDMQSLSVGEPELPAAGTTRIEDRPLFRTPGTIGMTAKQMDLYQRALEKMHAADVEWSQAQVAKEQRKQQSAEWKQARKETRAEVQADMEGRPDVAADLFFGRGELYGQKLPEKYRISWDDLTPEERMALPKDYIAKEGKGGVELDDVAELIGFPNGRALVNSLIEYNRAKMGAGMGSKAFVERITDIETDRRMGGRFGDLEENILDATKEQVTSDTQLNLIAEETLALGIRGGAEASINKAELKSWVEEKFAESPMAGQTSDKFLKAAGKSGTAAEIALLKEDFAAAFRTKQQQYMAMLLAKEARGLEKAQKQFAATAKRLAKRDVKGLDQEYQDVIQSLLIQAGLPTRRNTLEIQRSQAQSGYTGLDTFLHSAEGDGWAPEVSGDIAAGRVKTLDQMTVEEFRDFKSAIDSLNWIGRQVEKINIQGKAEDFAAYRDQVVANITSLPFRPRDAQERGIAHRMYSVDATLVRMENLMKDLDLGEDMGPLVNATIRPMTEAKHKEYSLQEGLSAQIKELNAKVGKEWEKSLKQDIPNDWFRNPAEDNLFKFSRMDMINIMLNQGNKGNQKKFAHGYGSPDGNRQATKAEAAVFQSKLMDWINTHATKEDWDFVQGVWDIYKGYRAEMDTVWRNTAGTQPKLVEPVVVDTPHGQYAGGYYPLVRDQYMSPLPKKGTGEELFGPDYPNFSTPQGHLKERTSATYFVDFQSPLSRIPMRMQQVIHDIAYRDAVMATAKVIRDKEIKGAIINHYGKEYADQLEPWLGKTARGSTFDEVNQKGIDSILRQVRLNLVNYALPWNYVVTLTPDVGSMNPKVLMNYYRDKKGNDEIANRLSKEIPHAMYNMDRDFKEAMARAVGEGRLDEAKAKAARWGYAPVSWASKQFRTATFIEKFNEARGEGRTEADAAALADTFVRERHGAVALHDLPSIMTTGEKGRLLTMFYGYFNTQYNLARTIPAHLRRGDSGKAFEAAWGSIIVGSFFGGLVANQAKEDDSWLKRFGKAVPMQLLGMVPFAREAATMAIEGIAPRTPYGSVLQAGVGLGGDVVKFYQHKPIEAGVKHIAATAGLVFGVPGTLQAGRTGQFLWDTHTGKQRPRNIYEWAHGIMTGEARLKRKGER